MLTAGVPPQAQPPSRRANGGLMPDGPSSDGSDSDESITEGGADEDLSKVVAGPSDPCKLVCRGGSSQSREPC